MTKVIFLDRDGTINVDHGYVHAIKDWQFVPGAIEGLQQLQAAGYTLTIITNQSGIAQDMYTMQDMEALHEFMHTELSKQGIIIAVTAFCPHGRDSSCDCRKPKTGMATQIEVKLGPIDYQDSWTIGDKTADLIFGHTLGTKTALVRSRYWQESDLKIAPTIQVDSLHEAAQYIVKG